MLRLFQRTCLRPSSPLRRQLVLSYGSVAIITLLAVTIVAIVASIHAGEVVKGETKSRLLEQVEQTLLQESAKYAAETFKEKHYQNYRGVAAIIHELIRDRIVGFPNTTSFENDQYVPFQSYGGGNQYPLQTPLLPSDWNITRNLLHYRNNEEVLEEHFQSTSRIEYFRRYLDRISTATPHYHVAGKQHCDPNEIDPISSLTYYPNCTLYHNNDEIDDPLAQKAADIGILLKPLWEITQEVLFLNVYFNNLMFDGGRGGAHVSFPGFVRDYHATYVSIGCDWMIDNINPFTKQPYATKEEISKCNPAGTIVSERDYNPMEMEFCKDQALHPEETRIFGPYRAPGRRRRRTTTEGRGNNTTTVGSSDNSAGDWIMTAGLAVFDRQTGHFLACTGVHFLPSNIERDLQYAVFNEHTETVFVRSDGRMVAGAGWKPDDQETDGIIHIADTGFLSADLFEELTSAVQWNEEWNPTEVMDVLSTNIHHHDEGKVFIAYPVPTPPDEYDPRYKPEFYIVYATKDDVFDVVNEVEDSIDDEVLYLIVFSVGLALLGTITLLAIIFTFSNLLTEELLWMGDVSSQIINHRNDDLIVEVEDFDPSKLHKTKCSRLGSNTEISDLVTEFSTMIHNFSGNEPAIVVQPAIHEIRNTLRWQHEFDEIYSQCVTHEALKEAAEHLRALHRQASKVPSEGGADENYPNFRSERLQQEVVHGSDTQHTAISLIEDEEDLGTRGCESLARAHLGSNVFSTWKRPPEINPEKIQPYKSKLFRRILTLIVCPLMVTIFLVSVTVALFVVVRFPSLYGTSQSESFSIELGSLEGTARLRASLIQEMYQEPIRNMYFLNRVVHWLLFDTIKRSDAFTTIEMSHIEECKEYLDDYSCPFFGNETRNVCSCDWEDNWRRDCRTYEVDPRYLQKMFLICQNTLDTDPETGNRMSSSQTYPERNISPETTKWWEDATTLPGAWKGANASGYETLYDRTRVLSAMAVIQMPLYNYVKSARNLHKRMTVATYFASEADGMLYGYAGCNHDFAQLAHYQLIEDNTPRNRPGLCPLGMYGYDARCRTWYASEQESLDPMVITPPTPFTTNDFGAGSVGSSIADPENGIYIGKFYIYC